MTEAQRQEAERVWNDIILALPGPIGKAKKRGINIIAAALAEKDREIENYKQFFDMFRDRRRKWKR